MSIEGAGLIAQVLPVLLLILVIERRALGPIRIVRGAPTRSLRRVGFLIVGLIAVSFSFLVEMLCIGSVVTQTPLNAWAAAPVTIVMLLLGVIVCFTLVELYVYSAVGPTHWQTTHDLDDKNAAIKARAKHVHKLRQKPKTRN